MRKLIISTAAAALLATAGCATTSKVITPAVVKQGASALVSYGVAKYPQSAPYIRAADEFICSQAGSSELNPAVVIAAIENSNAANFKTPEGVLIINSALALYTGVWNTYGADAVNNAPVLKTYLQATCEGISAGLQTSVMLRASTPTQPWPLIK